MVIVRRQLAWLPRWKVLFAVAFLVRALPAPATTASGDDDAPHERLAALADRTMALWITEHPELSLKYPPIAEQIPDQAPTARAAEARAAVDLERELDAINARQLSFDDQVLRTQVSWVLNHAQLEPQLGEFRFDSGGYGSAVFGIDSFRQRLPLVTAAGRDRYLRMVDQLIVMIDDYPARLASQARKGIRMPKPPDRQCARAVA